MNICKLYPFKFSNKYINLQLIKFGMDAIFSSQPILSINILIFINLVRSKFIKMNISFYQDKLSIVLTKI